MQKQEEQSRRWGIAALVLGAVVLVLASLAEKQRIVPRRPAHVSLTYPVEQNRWSSLIQLWFIRIAVAALGTVGLVLVLLFGIFVWGEIALHAFR